MVEDDNDGADDHGLTSWQVVEDGDVDDALTCWYVGSRESGRGAIHEKILGNQPALKKRGRVHFSRKGVKLHVHCPLFNFVLKK